LLIRFLAEEKSIIKESMKIIEDQTRKDGFNCIKFQNRTNNETNYLNIINDRGCYSEVGKIKIKQKKSQLLSLDSVSGCVVKETIIHELLHALMFNHEHQRPDRDEYIQIFMDNIDSSKLNAVFNKLRNSLP
jgi:hypothetical protein